MEENNIETTPKKKRIYLDLERLNEDYILNDKPRGGLFQLYDDIDKKFSEIRTSYYSSVIKETSLERIERKLDELRKEVATRDDIIAARDAMLEQTNTFLIKQKEMNETLQEQNDILRSMQESNVPHKRLAKFSIVFLIFFIFSFLSRIFFNLTIVAPLWNNLGLLLSFGFYVMSLAMKIDWRQKTNDN